MSEPRLFCVIDLEATCDDRGAVPKDEMETIEIGAVLVDAATLAPIESFQTFVRPVQHPELTAFCTELTSITQADVDAAPGFTDALTRLARFLPEDGALFSSWGEFDRIQLERDAAAHQVTLPFGGRHFNIKHAYRERLGVRWSIGVSAALERVGLRFEGRPHRGLDDAANIARLLPWALGRPLAPDR